MKLSICEHCRKKISGKGLLFINKAQKPSTHCFCSRRCKKCWQLNVKREKPKKITIWSIGEYLYHFYFIRKIVNKKGPNANISYFSENLRLIRKL